MKQSGVAVLLTVACVSAGAPLSAQEAFESPEFSATRTSLFRTSDLIYAGLFFGSLAAIYPAEAFDEALSPGSQPTGLRASFSSTGSLAGNAYFAYGVGGATFLAGKALGQGQVARIGLRSLEALLLADLIVTPFKFSVGRQRPHGLDPDSDEFAPFAFNNESFSFPSGHTAHMFAIASTLSRELGHQAPWVPYVAYSAAALTGVGRVVGQRHWVTDVLAGAAAGLFAGQFVGRLHGEEFIGLPFTPVISAGDGGVYVGANIRFR